jgi:hypothetical protein
MVGVVEADKSEYFNVFGDGPMMQYEGKMLVQITM